MFVYKAALQKQNNVDSIYFITENREIREIIIEHRGMYISLIILSGSNKFWKTIVCKRTFLQIKNTGSWIFLLKTYF